MGRDRAIWEVEAVVSATYLSGVSGKKLKIVAGVLRNDGSPNYFQQLGDPHVAINTDSVTTATDSIRINHAAIGATKVVTFLVGTDDTFAAASLDIGVSVGLTYSDVLLYGGPSYADHVSYNGAAWATVDGQFTIGAYVAGVLHLTHPPLAGNGYNTSVTGRGGVTVPNISSEAGTLSSSAVAIEFRDWAGMLLTTPNTDMKALVTRAATNRIINPQGLTTTIYPLSNIWYLGVFEVA